MSATVIAKKEFRDAIRSRTLLALTVLFTIFTAGGVAVLATIPAATGTGNENDPLAILFGLLGPASLFVPIIALLVGYKAIAGERERGSIYSLLGLSHSRIDVVVGKFVGRTGVVTVSILIGFAAGAISLYAFTGTISASRYLTFTAMTMLLGAVFVGLAVGLSSTTASTTRAAWGAFGIFLVFQYLWQLIGIVALFIASGSLPDEPPFPEWYLLFTQLNPQSAYANTSIALLGGENPMVAGTGIDPPVALEGWFSFGILVVWAVVPLCLGYVHFRTADL